MFEIIYLDNKKYTVYGTRTDTFLIYKNGLWTWVCMFDCTPVKGEV